LADKSNGKKDILAPREFGTAKLEVWYKQTRSLPQANWEFGAAKLGGWFLEQKNGIRKHVYKLRNGGNNPN